MHGRKASNPVLRLRIEETSVIKNLKTDNVKNTRPSSRGMMGFHSPNNRFSHGNNGDDKIMHNDNFGQKVKESPAGLRLRLGANIEKLRSPSRLRVDSTPRFKNKNLTSPFSSPSGRSTPPSPLALSGRKSLFNTSTNSPGGVTSDNGGSSPDSNYSGRSPSPLGSLTLQNSNNDNNNNNNNNTTANTTPRSRTASIGNISLETAENDLLNGNNSIITSTPRNSILSTENSPGDFNNNNNTSLSPSLSIRTNRSSSSSTNFNNFSNNNNDSPSSSSSSLLRNMTLDNNNNTNSNRKKIKTHDNNNDSKRRSSRSNLHNNNNNNNDVSPKWSPKKKDANWQMKHTNQKLFSIPLTKQKKSVVVLTNNNNNNNNNGRNRKSKIVVVDKRTPRESINNIVKSKRRSRYNKNLKHLRKDLDVKAYFNDNGNINMLSQYVKNESYLINDIVDEFINDIDMFQQNVDKSQKYLSKMAKKVDQSKLSLIGQRMQQINKEETYKRRRQDLTNDIELLSLRSERLEMEYTSLLRALEQQQALLTKLSSE